MHDPRSTPPGSGVRRPEPGDRLGRYRVLARLGAGAVGEVYRVEDEFGRQLALKPFTGAAEEERLARFEQPLRLDAGEVAGERVGHRGLHLLEVDHPPGARVAHHRQPERRRREDEARLPRHVEHAPQHRQIVARGAKAVVEHHQQ